MNRVLVVWDGYGTLIGVCMIGNKNQTEVSLGDMLEEWFEHGNGQVNLTSDEWEYIQSNHALGISIEVKTCSGDEIELMTRPLFDATHYDI
jgi:hypothetical protein